MNKEEYNIAITHFCKTITVFYIIQIHYISNI